MEFTIHIQVLTAVFVLAVILGAVANKTNFCTMGAVSDWVNMGDTGRLRAWLLAMAVALHARLRDGPARGWRALTQPSPAWWGMVLAHVGVAVFDDARRLAHAGAQESGGSGRRRWGGPCWPRWSPERRRCWAAALPESSGTR